MVIILSIFTYSRLTHVRVRSHAQFFFFFFYVNTFIALWICPYKCLQSSFKHMCLFYRNKNIFICFAKKKKKKKKKKRKKSLFFFDQIHMYFELHSNTKTSTVTQKFIWGEITFFFKLSFKTYILWMMIICLNFVCVCFDTIFITVSEKHQPF